MRYWYLKPGRMSASTMRTRQKSIGSRACWLGSGEPPTGRRSSPPAPCREPIIAPIMLSGNPPPPRPSALASLRRAEQPAARVGARLRLERIALPLELVGRLRLRWRLVGVHLLLDGCLERIHADFGVVRLIGRRHRHHQPVSGVQLDVFQVRRVELAGILAHE